MIQGGIYWRSVGGVEGRGSLMLFAIIPQDALQDFVLQIVESLFPPSPLLKVKCQLAPGFGQKRHS